MTTVYRYDQQYCQLNENDGAPNGGDYLARQVTLTAPPTTENRQHNCGKSATALRKIGDGR